MARRTPAPQATAPRAPPTRGGPAAGAGAAAEAQGGATLIAGRALVQTARHFFPDFNAWLDRLPDTRVPEATYPTRVLAWWGLALDLLQRGPRRQRDFDLRDGGPRVLANFNRRAEAEQTTLPAHDTRDHFVGHVRLAGWERRRRQVVQRLVRLKARDAARLRGRPVLLIDATGLICFRRRHCPHCLVQRHGRTTRDLHQAPEAKLLGPGGVVVSLAGEFIENADAADSRGKSAAEVKQDCAPKALHRLPPRIQQDYPQLPVVLALDRLYGCGPAFAPAGRFGWSFGVTFKEGRTQALGQDFPALLPAGPGNVRRREWADRPAQQFRWVKHRAYQDSEGRHGKLTALDGTERAADGTERDFAWLTALPVGPPTVEAVAQNGGRERGKMGNEGFNRQKNSGLNLEHVSSTDPEKWKAYYLLLQIAFALVQQLERGSRRRRRAAAAGRPVWQRFGSLKNVARRRRESVRFVAREEAWFDATQAEGLRLGLASS